MNLEEILNEERFSYTRNNITYYIGDIIDGEHLYELSGHNTNYDSSSKFILTQKSLNIFDNNIYSRKYLSEIYPENIDIDNDKINDMKLNFESLPPIPNNGDGIRRIIAAKELNHKTILMWEKIN